MSDPDFLRLFHYGSMGDRELVGKGLQYGADGGGTGPLACDMTFCLFHGGCIDKQRGLCGDAVIKFRQD